MIPQNRNLDRRYVEIYDNFYAEINLLTSRVIPDWDISSNRFATFAFITCLTEVFDSIVSMYIKIKSWNNFYHLKIQNALTSKNTLTLKIYGPKD